MSNEAQVNVKRANVLFMDGKLEEAFNMYRICAENGDAEAAFDLGFCFLFGYGTEKDEREAKTFFTYASMSIAEANYNLSVMYMHGIGVQRDYDKAFEYMHDAAVNGVIEAQLYLGIAHTIGTMFEPDIIALSLIPFHTPVYRDPSFMIEGDVPDLSEDEEKRIKAVRFDPRTSFEWFRISAKHSTDYVESLSAQGKFLYARCFIDGLGTEPNVQRGNDLMLVAAKDGSEDAMNYIYTCAPHLLQTLDKTDDLEAIRTREMLSSGLT